MKHFLYLAGSCLFMLGSQYAHAAGGKFEISVNNVKTTAPDTIINNGSHKMVKIEILGESNSDGTLQTEWEALGGKRKVLTKDELGQQSLSEGDGYKVQFAVPIAAVDGNLYFVKDPDVHRDMLARRHLQEESAIWWQNLFTLDQLMLKVFQLFFGDSPSGAEPPPLETIIRGTDWIHDITVIINKGGGGSDPHFKTWGGKKFDYHGECDLVLFSDHNFHHGAGLDVHIRTTIVTSYSYISNVAVRIGTDVLEVTSDGSFYLNYEEEETLPADVFGFPLEFNRNEDGSIEYVVSIGRNEEIVTIRANKGFLWVSVALGQTVELMGHSYGMMGSYPKGDFVARDNSTIFADPVAFSEEWQVRDTEAMLFHEVRQPQYPQRCIPPPEKAAISRKRRLRDAAFMEKAANACEKWGNDKDECIADVVATGNLEMANIPLL